ncbi:MAG: hypothetical protein R3A10_11565 [Caldilineaceae bacterium]
MSHPQEGEHTSWRQKSAALSRWSSSAAPAPTRGQHVAHMRPIALATDTIPAGYGTLVLSTVA